MLTLDVGAVREVARDEVPAFALNFDEPLQLLILPQQNLSAHFLALP